MTHVPLTRRYANMVASLELGAAITGLILPTSHFHGVSYTPAARFVKDVLHLPGDPSTWWSWLLVTFSVAALVSIHLRNDRWTRHFFAALCSWWVFWAVLYAAAWSNPTSGPWGPWLAAIAVVGNSRPVIAPSLSD
jgi:hypothetical protein